MTKHIHCGQDRHNMSGLTRWFRKSFRLPNARPHGTSDGEPRKEQRKKPAPRGGDEDLMRPTTKASSSRSLQKEERATSRCQQCERNELEQRESLAEMDMFYKQKINETRYILKQKEGELKLLKHRMAEVETVYKDKLYEARAALKLKEEEVKLFKYRRNIKKQSQRSSCKQCEQNEHDYRESLAEMETMYKAKLNEAKCSTAEIESFYKQQLSVVRSALRQKEENLKSFKDRMAADLTSSIETGDTENMSNPVSQTRLKKMYDKLKLQQWPKVKDCLKANNGSSQTARAVIQKWFQEAAKQMEKRKEQINEVFGLTQDNKEPTHQKVKEYRQLTVQNLQLALYHSGREHNQISLPQYDGQYPQDVVDIFRSLVSECYQLGCLMALNHPPLIPDWQNHVPGMDSWDIFPQDITTVGLI